MDDIEALKTVSLSQSKGGCPGRGKRTEDDAGVQGSLFHPLTLLSVGVPHPIPSHTQPLSLHQSRHKCEREK